MTREEIISGLKFTVEMFLLDPSTGETITEPRNDMNKTTIDACRGAIELLEQEPCEDCISRQYLLDNCIVDKATMPYVPISKIENAPPVNPQPKTEHWIPCSERPPQKSGDYWCTFGGINLTGSDFYTTESDAKKLFDDPEEYTGCRSQNVIAWMPLPTHYEPQESDPQESGVSK